MINDSTDANVNVPIDFCRMVMVFFMCNQLPNQFVELVHRRTVRFRQALHLITVRCSAVYMFDGHYHARN